MNDPGKSRVARPRVNAYVVWSVVNAIRAVLIACGIFAIVCSAFSMFFRQTDDNVIVGAIFFGAFTVCVAAIAIVAGLHRVFLAVHSLGEELNDIAEPPAIGAGDEFERP